MKTRLLDSIWHNWAKQRHDRLFFPDFIENSEGADVGEEGEVRFAKKPKPIANVYLPGRFWIYF